MFEVENDENQAHELLDHSFYFDSWYSIIISTTSWAIFYNLTLKIVPREKEYCCRIISFLHGVITAFIGINNCFAIDTPFYHPEWQTTRSQKCLMVFSLGYFIHDLIWVILNQRDSKLMICHHTFSIFALYRMLYRQHSGAQTVCALGSMEITNPVLQIRWFLRTEGFYPSTWYASTELTFFLFFILARIVLGTYYLFIIVFQPNNYWDFLFLSSAIYLISWIFTINIIRYFVNMYGTPIGRNYSSGRKEF